MDIHLSLLIQFAGASKLTKLNEALSRLSFGDTVASLAALQLDPRNAHQLQRLEAVVEAAACRSRGSIVPSLAQVVELANSAELTHRFARLEDPPEGVFCEEVRGPGGRFLAGCGITGQSTFALRVLLRVLFGYRELAPGLNAALLPLVLSALSVSDAVMHRAGLRRGMPWAGEKGGPVDAPKNYDGLLDAVRVGLPPGDLSAAAEVLAPLIADPAHPGLSFASQPFLLDDAEIVVAAPFEIASALRHHVAKEIVRRGIKPEFQLRSCFAVGEIVTQAFTRMRMTPLSRDEVDLPWPRRDLPMVELVFRFDADKLAHVLLLADDLRGYRLTEIFQDWPLSEIEAAASARLEQVAARLMRRADTREVMSVVALAPLDRGLALRISSDHGPVFCAHVRELEALSFKAHGNPLALWKFVQARTELTTRAERVHAFSPLDLYVIYHAQDESFNRIPPEAVVVAKPGGTGVLCEEAARRFDPHPVATPDGSLIEVERWLPHAPDVPMYLPWITADDAFRCLVEHDDLLIWVCGPAGHAGAYVGHSIAYWLWQVAEEIADDLRALADENGVVRFEFELDLAAPWQPAIHEIAPRPADTREPFAEPYLVSPTEAGLRLLKGAWLAFHDADNSGERQLLVAMLTLLLRSTEDSGERIAEIVDRYAPPGYKKHLMLFRGADPRLSEDGLPPYRPVQSHDRNVAMRAISALTLNAMKDRWEHPDLQPKEVFDAYVAASFGEFERRVAELSPEGLLEQLILLNERVVQEQAQRQISMLTRQLCYGDLDEEIAARPHEWTRMNTAGICTRFLIEYVATRPPTGDRAFSTAAFDELLALAREILDVGGGSDAIHHGLPGLQAIVAAEFEHIIFLGNDAQDAFLDEQIAAEVAAGDNLLEALAWKPAQELHTPSEELERAIRAELGIGVMQLGSFFNTLIEVAIDADGGLAVVTIEDAIAELAHQPEWTRTSAAKAIDMFSLSPRASFLDPEEPHRRSDVYPWRVNRSLSYIRRPLIRRGEHLIFGVRHLFNAQTHLATQLDSACFPARSPELKRLQSKYGNRIGRAFEKAVADLFRDNPSLHLRPRFRGLDSAPFVDEKGRALGDIDALVIDPRRRQILVIDTKAVQPAKTPSEIAQEAADLFGDRPDSTAARQRARASWVERNLPGVIGLSGSSVPVDPDTWSVEPLIVTDRPLISSHVTSPSVRVVTYLSLQEMLAVGTVSVCRDAAIPDV